MPIRARAAEQILVDAVGHQVWNGLTGECQTMPTEAWEAGKEAADVLYERVIRYVDWTRTMVEAMSRHYALDHLGDRPCGSCVRDALLGEDRPLGPPAPPPRRDTGQDCLGILADLKSKWKRTGP